MLKPDIKYTIDFILSVAFPGFDGLLTVDCNIPGFIINNKTISLYIIDDNCFNEILLGNYQMQFIKSHNEALTIPAVMADECFCSIIDSNELRINADIISLSFILLSRYEDMVCVAKRDKYRRFSYEHSLAKKYGFIDYPIIDEYALLLRKAVMQFIPFLEIKPRLCRIIPTHDIDNLSMWSAVKYKVRRFTKNKSLRGALSLVYYIIRAFIYRKKDPYIVSLLELLTLSRSNGYQSEFYFMGYPDDNTDKRYDVTHRMFSYCTNAIENAGMVVGFHSGFNSHDSINEFKQQKHLIETALGSKITRGRQHYLCFDALLSPKIWEQCGIETDLTLGFHDREGFMCGTAHPFYLYDLEQHKQLKVLEQPLCVMDVTLRVKRKLSDTESYSKICTLCERALAVEGDFVILWHNSSVIKNQDWHRNVYVRFIENYATDFTKKAIN